MKAVELSPEVMKSMNDLRAEYTAKSFVFNSSVFKGMYELGEIANKAKSIGSKEFKEFLAGKLNEGAVNNQILVYKGFLEDVTKQGLEVVSGILKESDYTKILEVARMRAKSDTIKPVEAVQALQVLSLPAIQVIRKSLDGSENAGIASAVKAGDYEKVKTDSTAVVEVRRANAQESKDKIESAAAASTTNASENENLQKLLAQAEKERDFFRDTVRVLLRNAEFVELPAYKAQNHLDFAKFIVNAMKKQTAKV